MAVKWIGSGPPTEPAPQREPLSREEQEQAAALHRASLYLIGQNYAQEHNAVFEETAKLVFQEIRHPDQERAVEAFRAWETIKGNMEGQDYQAYARSKPANASLKMLREMEWLRYGVQREDMISNKDRRSFFGGMQGQYSKVDPEDALAHQKTVSESWRIQNTPQPLRTEAEAIQTWRDRDAAVNSVQGPEANRDRQRLQLRSKYQTDYGRERVINAIGVMFSAQGLSFDPDKIPQGLINRVRIGGIEEIINMADEDQAFEMAVQNMLIEDGIWATSINGRSQVMQNPPEVMLPKQSSTASGEALGNRAYQAATIVGTAYAFTEPREIGGEPVLLESLRALASEGRLGGVDPEVLYEAFVGILNRWNDSPAVQTGEFTEYDRLLALDALGTLTDDERDRARLQPANPHLALPPLLRAARAGKFRSVPTPTLKDLMEQWAEATNMKLDSLWLALNRAADHDYSSVPWEPEIQGDDATAWNYDTSQTPPRRTDPTYAVVAVSQSGVYYPLPFEGRGTLRIAPGAVVSNWPSVRSTESLKQEEDEKRLEKFQEMRQEAEGARSFRPPVGVIPPNMPF